MEKTEAIVLKGTIEGVKVILSDDASISEILDALHQKVRAARSFFRGSCNIIVVGKEITHSDEIRISSVLRAMLPESNIVFGEAISKNHTHLGEKLISELEEKAQNTQEKLKGIVVSTDSHKEILPEKNNVRLYDGNIKNGQTINSPTDIIIVGSVLDGGEVLSRGSIYIIGKLDGYAHAGVTGDMNSKIFASNFGNGKISICEFSTNFSEKFSNNAPQIAFLTNNSIFFKEIL